MLNHYTTPPTTCIIPQPAHSVKGKFTPNRELPIDSDPVVDLTHAGPDPKTKGFEVPCFAKLSYRAYPAAAVRWESPHKMCGSCAVRQPGSEPVLSWPKTPSVAPDGYHERESEYRRFFLAQKSAREVTRASRSRQSEANFEVNLSVPSTSNQPGRRGA